MLVKRGDTEYAIVADDNYAMNDPYFNAMFDAETGWGAPRVNVGGKLGIIKDPFGEAKYLGATIPLDGYGVADLSVSADGKVLVGNLRGRFGAVPNEPMKQSKSQVWNVDDLIKAALTMPDQDRLKKHLEPEKMTGGGVSDTLFSFLKKVSDMLPSVISSAQAATIGTVAAQPAVEVKTVGRMGDVIEIDLRELIAKKLGLSEADKAKLTGFTSPPTELAYLKDGLNMSAVFTKDGEGLYSRDKNAKEATFKTEGRLYLVPNLDGDDLRLLREGKRVTDKRIVVDLKFSRGDGKTTETVRVDVVAKDFEDTQGRVFFGDRPLENPGYSAFTLSDDVSVDKQEAKTIDVLDVYRVEQRLKYLGYSAFGPIKAESYSISAMSKKLRVPLEFAVDGRLGEKEETALRAFYGATHYTKYYGDSSKKDDSSGINGFQTTLNNVSALKVAKGSSDEGNLGWLNAYNAPHWMNVYSSIGLKIGGRQGKFVDGTDTKAEIYSTSWTLDVLRAWDSARAKQGLTNGDIQINGLTDPTYDFLRHNRGGHSIGMGLDLGISRDYISHDDYQIDSKDKAGITPVILGRGWSMDNAKEWADLLVSDRDSKGQAKNDQRGALRNFLSIYALTQNDNIFGNGTWDDLRPKNGPKALEALFGSGDQSDQALIQNVWIGGRDNPEKKSGDKTQNPYPGIHAVLRALGFDNIKSGQDAYKAFPHADTQEDHHNHFHIDLRPPARVGIEPTKKLMAVDAQEIAEEPSASDEVRIVIEELLAQSAIELNIDEGDANVLILDLPPVAPQFPQVLIAQAGQTKMVSPKERVLGACKIVPSNDPLPPPESRGDYVFNSILAAELYLRSYEQREVDRIGVKVTVLQGPKQGILEDNGAGDFAYFPKPGYVGKDRATIQVEIDGIKVKIVYFIQTIEDGAVGNTAYERLCGNKGSRWKISRASDVLQGTLDFNQLLNSATNAALKIANSTTLNLDGINLSVAAFAGGTLAETTGRSVTLSPTAAGYGWFVDSTPTDNTEYLPTANPYEWVAKADSAAAGKMDMLSVLLHEYGHVLGIEHSANGHDYMATTLAPGVRRLPSADELALMSKLAGELRLELAPENTSSPDAPKNVPLGDAPSSPLPTAPLGGSLGLALLGRLRGNRFGGWNVVVESASPLVPTAPQYAVAANPKLSNTEFAGGQGWSTTGDVRFQGGAATLTETATSQTRLNQVFIVGENDRLSNADSLRALVVTCRPSLLSYSGMGPWAQVCREVQQVRGRVARRVWQF